MAGFYFLKLSQMSENVISYNVLQKKCCGTKIVTM